MKTRFTSIFPRAALTLLVMMLTATTAWAQETNGTCGEDVTWTYNVETHTLTIGGTGAMYDYPVGNQPWYDFRSAIENVVIESGVTSIGIDAFDNCARIKNVYVLRYDDTDQDNPDLTELGQSVFDDNSALSKIYVPNADAYKDANNWVNYEDLIQAFDGTCGDPDVNDGKDLYWTYANHTLTIVGTGAMADGDQPWGIRSNITEIIIGDGVTHIGDYAFAFLTRLNTVTIPANVTSIGEGAFFGCSNLTTVFAWPTTAPTLVDNAFNYCSNSMVVYVKNSEAYTDWNYNIQPLMPCGRDDNDDVYCAYNNGTLTIVGSGAMVDYNSTNQSWSDYQEEITKVVIGGGVTHIGDYAFANLTRLNTVTIPDGVESIGSYVFEGCTYLTAVTIGSSVTEINDGAFQKCPSLQSVVMMPEEAPSLAPDAFMPDDSNDDFLAPSYLKIYVPNSTYDENGWSELTGQMVEYDWISGDCAVVEDQTYDGEQYKYSLTIAGGGAMADYDDENDRPWYWIHDNITSLKINEGVTSIGDNAFSWSSGLSTVTIPRSVATIGDNAFEECNSLVSVTILGNTEYIGDMAFNCSKSSLDHVTCYAATPPALGTSVFSFKPDYCKLYVLHNLKSSYEDAWSEEFKENEIENITITYINEDGEEVPRSEFTVLNSSDFTKLSDSSIDDLAYNLDDEWYIVNSDMNFFYPINLNSQATHIILCDGCTMNVGTDFAPISDTYCITGDALKIYAQNSDAAIAGNLNLVSTSGALFLSNYDQYGGNVTISADEGTGLYATGNIIVNGGTLDATTISTDEDEYGMNAEYGTITLGWTHAETDYIKASSYNGTVQVADEQALKYIDDDDKIVKLIGDIANLDDISHRKLTAYGYGGYCGNADLNDGKNLRWDIPLVDDDNDDETPLQPGHVMNITKNPDVNEGEDFSMADYTGSDTPWKDYDDYLSLIFVDTEADYAAYVTNLNDDDQAKLAPTTITIAKNESGWSTFCHNYPVAYSLSDNASAHSISGLSDNNTNVSISDDLGIAEPAIPLLLRYSNEGENVILTAQPETAPAAVSSTAIVSSDFEGGSFYGNCSNTFVSPADLDDSYDEGQTYLLYNGKFIQADENGGLDAHKCLLVLSGTNNAPVLTIGETTSLENVQCSMFNVQCDNSWFTLDGRKLDKQPTAKGVYIYNSKKVVIK